MSRFIFTFILVIGISLTAYGYNMTTEDMGQEDELMVGDISQEQEAVVPAKEEKAASLTA